MYSENLFLEGHATMASAYVSDVLRPGRLQYIIQHLVSIHILPVQKVDIIGSRPWYIFFNEYTGRSADSHALSLSSWGLIPSTKALLILWGHVPSNMWQLTHCRKHVLLIRSCRAGDTALRSATGDRCIQFERLLPSFHVLASLDITNKKLTLVKWTRPKDVQEIFLIQGALFFMVILNWFGLLASKPCNLSKDLRPKTVDNQAARISSASRHTDHGATWSLTSRKHSHQSSNNFLIGSESVLI